MDLTHITTALRDELAAGRFQVDDRWHTFYELSELFADELTNLGRIRSAIQPLIAEGLIESIQGSGSYVRALPEGKTAPDLRVVLEQLRADLSDALAKVHLISTHLQSAA